MDFFTGIDSRWIGEGASEATYYRRSFVCAAPQGVRCAICAAGWYELYVNGRKVGDRVMDPIVSIYDKHVRYSVFDLTEYLTAGENIIGVTLGNGWYNCPISGQDAWSFCAVPWKAYPRFRLEVKSSDGAMLLGSDSEWDTTPHGPIRYNSFRSGETYDARLELDGWASSHDTPHPEKWHKAGLAKSPGGLIEEQYAEPVKVLDSIPLSGPNRFQVYDAGVNIAGHARIFVRGEAGTKIVMQYAERLTDDGEISLLHQNGLNGDPRFQRDEYILKGSPDGETWETTFAYHGFRYVQIDVQGKAEILRAEARIVASAFDSIGKFESSSATLNKLQELTRRSYLSNFVGIPTDCPHREKNGWTGDAQLASETGLYNFDSARSYRQWIDTMRDCQRPNGDLPGYVPTGGMGYNWGDGPAWDCAFFVIPYHVWLYTGDDSTLKANYEGMKRYIELYRSMSIDHIVQYGLGDWCPEGPTADFKLSVTACFADCLRIAAKTADLLGKTEDAAYFRSEWAEVKAGFNRAFYKGNGVYENDNLTALGTALYFDLCDTDQKELVAKHLAEKAAAVDCKAFFGILGAKYVPRVLADNGYADLAARFFLQEEFPGWAHWIKRGATSLWEIWTGICSRNHIMFGDLSAWFYRYLGGFRHDELEPGRHFLHVEPHPVKALTHVRAEYASYVSDWTYEEGVFTLRLTVPAGCRAALLMPDGTTFDCTEGTVTKTCRM